MNKHWAVTKFCKMLPAVTVSDFPNLSFSVRLETHTYCNKSIYCYPMAFTLLQATTHPADNGY
jgi:hypothetical protein